MSKESKYPEPFDEFMRTAKRHLTWAERITVWSDETGKWVQHGTFDDPYEAIMPAAYFSRGGNAMMVMYGKMQQIDEARDNEPIGRPRRVRVSVLLRPTDNIDTDLVLVENKEGKITGPLEMTNSGFFPDRVLDAKVMMKGMADDVVKSMLAGLGVSTD